MSPITDVSVLQQPLVPFRVLQGDTGSVTGRLCPGIVPKAESGAGTPRAHPGHLLQQCQPSFLWSFLQSVNTSCPEPAGELLPAVPPVPAAVPAVPATPPVPPVPAVPAVPPVPPVPAIPPVPAVPVAVPAGSGSRLVPSRGSIPPPHIPVSIPPPIFPQRETKPSRTDFRRIFPCLSQAVAGEGRCCPFRRGRALGALPDPPVPGAAFTPPAPPVPPGEHLAVFCCQDGQAGPSCPHPGPSPPSRAAPRRGWKTQQHFMCWKR